MSGVPSTAAGARELAIDLLRRAGSLPSLAQQEVQIAAAQAWATLALSLPDVDVDAVELVPVRAVSVTPMARPLLVVTDAELALSQGLRDPDSGELRDEGVRRG